MATKVSIDRVLDAVLPWDLSIEIDGEAYQTRPLTLGDLAVLQAASEGQAVDLAALIAQIESLFHITPPVRDWSLEQVMAVVHAVMSYWAERSKKSQPLLLDAIRRQGNAPSPATTPPATSGS